MPGCYRYSDNVIVGGTRTNTQYHSFHSLFFGREGLGLLALETCEARN